MKTNFKIASWNVNSIKVRHPQVLEWLQAESPDVLALQETKSIDENFPKNEINEIGYHSIFSGQKTYNGVAILSKSPITEYNTEIPNLEDPQKRILAATYKGIRIINVYVPNGQSVGSDKYNYKLNWLLQMQHYIKAQLQEFDKLIILGDFNIAPEDQDVHDPTAWDGHVLVSPDERKAFQTFIDAGLHDSFRLFEQEAKIYSWWDYRQAAFRRNRGMRIDHILVSEALKKCCTKAWIDKTPRKVERPSDHTPVLAEFVLAK